MGEKGSRLRGQWVTLLQKYARESGEVIEQVNS